MTKRYAVGRYLWRHKYLPEMYKSNFLWVCRLIALSALFQSCAKVGPSGANGLTGPAGPSYTNNVILGHVSLYDAYGTSILADRNHVQLSLNNGPANYADTTGLFEYSGLSTGNYQLTASDSGFAATHIGPFQCVLDTVYRDIRMSAIPTFNPISALSTPASGGVAVAVNFTSDTRVRSCILFLFNDTTVSNDVGHFVAAYTVSFGGGTASLVIPAQDLYNYGFVSGSKVYLAAYGYAVNDQSAYEDMTTGKTVYLAVSPAHVLDSLVTP
jgi:hypothetical protein